MNVWRYWQWACFDLLFPPRCLLCGTSLSEPVRAICNRCLAAVDYMCPPLCRCCGMKIAGGGTDQQFLCGACLRQPPPYRQAVAIFQYDQATSLLLHRLKYYRDTSVLPGLLRILEAQACPRLPHAEIIVPVPLHRRRLQERGLNQSAVLAQLFFPERLHDIRPDFLKRIRDTPAQTTLDGATRRKNLKLAFAVHDPRGILRGRSVCLVDDVFTTGTTVAECSRALIQAGVSEVSVLTMARVISAL